MIVSNNGSVFTKLKDYVKSIVAISALCELTRVILTGPKGVGKSISLLALAVELAQDHDLVYFSSFSIYREPLLDGYPFRRNCSVKEMEL